MMMKLARGLAAAAVMVVAAEPAGAGSAIIYGGKSVQVISRPSEVQAMREGFEACSAVDFRCRVLFICTEPGYGAVATAFYNGFVESVGGSCGQTSGDLARAKALDFCKTNAKMSSCQISNLWLE